MITTYQESGLVRIEQRRFVKFVIAKWGGAKPPTADQANAAFAHALHLALYVPASSKLLSPHDFQVMTRTVALPT